MNNKCKIVAVEHLTLDGVYQAPARADEDTRDGFKYGGWSVAGDDPKMKDVIGKYMSSGWSMLTGTRTYEDQYEDWAVRQPEDPMTGALTNIQKFVVSRDPGYHLRWKNSTLLAGEAAQTIAELKNTHDRTLMIFGSGQLVRSLMPYGLIDDLLLMVHPLILGEGLKLFDTGTPYSKLKLTGHEIAGTGVALSTYQTIAP